MPPGPGCLPAFTMESSSCGIIECAHSWTSLMSMTALSGELTSTESNLSSWVAVTTTRLRCGTTSRGVVYSPFLAISTTSEQRCSTTSTHGSSQPATTRPCGSGTGKAGTASLCSPATTTMWCALSSIHRRTWWSRHRWTRQSVCGTFPDWERNLWHQGREGLMITWKTPALQVRLFFHQV